MDLQVTKVDKAYATSESLNNKTVKTSTEISQDMERVLNNMKAHWKGEDATLHINEWIDKYDKLGDYFTELNKTTNHLQNYFVNLQVCRSRVTVNPKVGDVTSEKHDFNPISTIDTTEEYYFDEKLLDDFKELQEISKKYDSFVDDVDNNMNEVFQNWKIGIGRDEVGKYYQRIENFSRKLSSEIHAQNDKLETVIHNIEKINK